jgi:hypothetical protein
MYVCSRRAVSGGLGVWLCCMRTPAFRGLSSPLEDSESVSVPVWWDWRLVYWC